MSALARLGWSLFFQGQVTTDLERFRTARVVEEQRGQCRVAGAFDGWAEPSGRFRHLAQSSADYPVVGDWVSVAADSGGDRAIIHHRFERRSVVCRQAAGTSVGQQLLAANVDMIFLVTALTRDLNPRRLERYLTMVWEAGATPVVVLTKADLADDPEGMAEGIRRRFTFVDVVVVRALEEGGLTDLLPYLVPEKTVALLGSSGVGKSTIVNRLLGEDRISIGAVREADGKGRHTTTSRQLVELPGGGLLIDTPGMRELQLWASESSVESAFEDIADLARSCRFTDCGHAGEPGCAVAEAVRSAKLDEGRLESYRRLLREAAYEERKRDAAAAAEHKRRWKQIHKAQRSLQKERDR